MKKIVILIMSCCVLLNAGAQKKSAQPVAPKKALSAAVYDSWKEIPWKGITPDGNFAAVTINPQDGDGKTVFMGLKAGTADSVKRASNIFLTYDSGHAVFKISPPQSLVKDLRRQKKKKEDLPKDSLGIYSFSIRKSTKTGEVRSFTTAEKEAGWVAYSLEPGTEEKPKSDASKSDQRKKCTQKAKKNSDENGYTPVVRNLERRREVR